MIVIDNTIVSEHLLEKKFVCDLNACKGQCCVEGDSGAPLEDNETAQLDEHLDVILPYLPEEGKQAITEQGAYVVDFENELTTPLVDGKHCAYTYFEKGIAKCGIEKASKEHGFDFNKPISCYLYPVRITKFKDYDAVNYDQWSICRSACSCGEQLNVPVYQFLKKPLIKKYGIKWYEQLHLANELKKQQD